MLHKIIQWSLDNRLLVIIGAVALLVYGGLVALRSPVDVFPDLTGFGIFPARIYLLFIWCWS